MMVKMGQRREIISFGVFHYEHRARLEQPARQHGSGDVAKPRHIIRRVGKHYVIRLSGRVAYVSHRIGAQQTQIVVMQLTGHFLYEPSLHRRLLYRSDRRRSARQKFKRDCPVPANRSRQRAPSMSMIFSMTLNMFSRAKSVVGRAVILVGTLKRRRPYFPLIIRIMVRLLNQMVPSSTPCRHETSAAGI